MNEHPNNEEILEAAKNNKMRGMEYENRVGTKSNIFGFLVTLIIGTVLGLVEYFVRKTLNLALLVLLFSAGAVQMLYEGIRLKSVWQIVLGSIEALLAIFFAIAFIGQVIS